MSLLKTYQKEGVAWMLSRERDETTPGGVQCDEVGLGKTIMTIETMNKNPMNKTLLLVPKSLIGQWVSELEKWYQYQLTTIDKISQEPCLVIASISSMYKTNTPYHQVEWERIVIDEAHSIKNPRSKTHKSVCELQGKIKWALTATPVMNKMSDFWGILKWIGEDIESVFTNKADIVNKYFIRRTQDLLTLPGYTVHNIEEEFSEKEQKLYDKIEEYIKKVIPTTDSRFYALEKLMRLVQISVHPQIFYNAIANKHKFEPDEWKYESTKFKMLKTLLNKKEKTLIFCKFVNEIKSYQRLFPGSLILHGSLKTEQREEVLQAFKKSDIPFLFIQEKVGSCGLNLQVAQRIIFTSPNWSPALEHQAIGRSHRTGQTSHVNVYKLYIKNSIEEKIVEIQKEKKNVFETLWLEYRR